MTAAALAGARHAAELARYARLLKASSGDSAHVAGVLALIATGRSLDTGIRS